MRSNSFFSPTFSLLFLALFFPKLCTCVLAQNTPDRQEKTAELGVRDAALLDDLMYTVPGVAAPTDAIRQNVKAYMMPIREAPDARTEWAYALTSVLEYYRNLNQNFKDNLSPDYLQLSLANQGTRPNLEDGLRLLVREGTVSASIMPYGSTLVPGAVYSVPKVKIANYGYLFREEARPRNRIFEIKKALSRGNPVLLEVATPPGFTEDASTATTAPVSELHYLSVVGYDSGTETFEVRGSFGRMWGEAGYAHLSYTALAQMSRRAFVLIPHHREARR